MAREQPALPGAALTEGCACPVPTGDTGLTWPWPAALSLLSGTQDRAGPFPTWFNSLWGLWRPRAEQEPVQIHAQTLGPLCPLSGPTTGSWCPPSQQPG